MSIMTEIRDFDHAIDVLDDWLRGLDYNRAARDGIRTHIEINGDLAGIVPRFLDAEHLEAANEILVDALPAVTYSSPEWGIPGRITLPVEPIAWDSVVTLTAADVLPARPSSWTDEVGDTTPDDFDWDAPGPEAPDESITRAPGYAERLAADGITLVSDWVHDQVELSIPPISGGSPEADEEVFIPSDRDWEEYREMQEEMTVRAYLARRGYDRQVTDEEIAQLAAHGCI